MDRFLALPSAERELAFQQTAAARGLASGSVEKDFWACLMLRELFNLTEFGEHLTFKGGTSLSKAWGLIDRFSEDIDLTIDRDILGFSGDHGPEAANSRKEQERRLQALKHSCGRAITKRIGPALTARMQAILQTKESWSLTSDDDDPDEQTLLFAYPRPVAAATPSYVIPAVKLEFGARSDPWPVSKCQITSLVAEQFPRLFVTSACTVRALLPERTFWEKVMLLHEETFRPPGKSRRPRMARHYYDVWRLIEAGVSTKAAADGALFERVAAHRRVFFRHGWMDYDTLKRGTIRIVPLAEQVEEWRRDYSAMQGEMFLGTPPEFDVILARIALFQSEFNSA